MEEGYFERNAASWPSITLTADIGPIYTHGAAEQPKAYRSNKPLDTLHETYQKTKKITQRADNEKM